MTNHPTQTEAPGDSVIGALIRLGAALAVLDGTDPDTDSISFDRATDQLITATRDTVNAARPVLATPCALAAAIRDAITELRDGAARCWACDQTSPEPCTDHAADLAQATVYEALQPAITYGSHP